MQLTGLFATAFALLASTAYAQTGSQGTDTGNKFCTGQCLPKSSDLPCSNPEWQASLGCYICCLDNDNAGGFADSLPDDILPDDIIGDDD
ncbi:uncharacterized protein AKAW2_11181A [Aspergillus luchuensis]|uniref:Endo-1,3(4)-beta-glucanase 1 carbohydrate binding domain-containing protein n=2 Tax=Aspergillus subgen. Circumdati TaxID=2720871 RepID=A0A8G1QXX3_9EURO|nr:hypothetical protein BO85DRAFT_461278 [Aspergillus piperis CBS 112811]XP_041537901.1 uncharacterized protein AKAW2_11181A [Aspergillus luchuensis]GAA84248.1 similar to An02g14040 [Aspergillus luchuensis IFO 4308]RAH55653.1 hypothetical protein BO85DRAFT_461278 [Aspergillus piperis CBS 112811]BCR94135.1 hypothetical protein AKAW2_11181A [Aspergillus luchuensis]BCS06743.1 hypothetical protein ALUC_11124A [Aspergillus luchuensis]GAT24085.1 similar to An02g14040 [Aspergillus luchuensis]